MQALVSPRVRFLVTAVLGALAFAQPGYTHHNSQAEFGPFASPTIYVEGRIIDIHWGNPHISIDVEITGGALPAGEMWRLVSHPIRIM